MIGPGPDPITQITTYGRPGDPYRWIRERYVLRGDVLHIEIVERRRAVLGEFPIEVKFAL